MRQSELSEEKKLEGLEFALPNLGLREYRKMLFHRAPEYKYTIPPYTPPINIDMALILKASTFGFKS